MAAIEDEEEVRRKYSGETYQPHNICTLPTGRNTSYSDALLSIKLDLVRSECPVGGTVLDLCCATGGHTLALSSCFGRGIGVDFSLPFIHDAERRRLESRVGNVSFVAGNARALPISSGSIDTVYCLSSLYYIPTVKQVFAEVSRVLKPKGRFIAEIGTGPCLNQLVCASYPELAKLHLPSLPQAYRSLEEVGLELMQIRSFQLLPMWGNDPRWLRLLLSERVKATMMVKIGGHMIDERISSLPLLRRFSFRHLVVCRKEAP